MIKNLDSPSQNENRRFLDLIYLKDQTDWQLILYKLWKLNRGQTNNLSMKQGSLFCSFCQVEIFQTTMPASCRTLGIFISLESSWWVGGVHRLYCKGWKLSLIIEPFFHWKLNKIKTENCIGIWGVYCCSWFCWKALGEWDLMEFISQFSELRCERYWFLSGFCSKPKFQKLGLEGKI